jgi:pimeloyl-ACP methyl ester carboxylesterase
MQVLRRAIVSALFGTLMCAAGCGIVPPEATLLDPAVRKPTELQAQRGLVWLFPGIVGVPWELGPAYRGLCAAGLDKEVRFFEWDIPAPDFFAHLTRYAANEESAAEVADQIAEYHRRYPEQPIDLVGYSAGGFLAVLIVEALPPDVHVHNVVLAQPAISPTYDLTPALERIDAKLVNFYCARDWLLSGLFAFVFGTMDREHTASAGLLGFNLDVAAPDPELRSKVEEIAWSPVMAKYGHPGNHMGILDDRWNKYCIAPYVVAPESLLIDPPLGKVAAAE